MTCNCVADDVNLAQQDAPGTGPNGIVFDIQRHALHDGPGIRTTVFLKGCLFHCPWCQNPESMKLRPEPDRSNSSRIFGCSMTVEETMDVVRRDLAYYEASGGGLTVSGGEPFVQYDFLMALLRAAKSEGIGVCLDTTGHVERWKLESTLPWVDVYHYDYKDSDPVRHRRNTGGSLELVVENLEVLLSRGAEAILRCPIIPGVNDDDGHFTGIAALKARHPGLVVEILPFHDMGQDKWTRVGREYPLAGVKSATGEQKEEWRRRFLALGIPVILD